MAYTLSQVAGTTPRDVPDGGLRRSFSGKDLHRRARMRRSYSDNHLCYSVSSIGASTAQPKLKTSRSVGIFNIQLSRSMIPDGFKSFLFDPETSKEANVETSFEESVRGEGQTQIDEEKKRANWIERLVELRNNWKGKQDRAEEYVGGNGEGCNEEGGCEVEYEEDEGRNAAIDRETFLPLLRHVSWSDAKRFSQLAFLCNMAYVIADMKTGDLKRYYGLDFVTSSLEKKAEAAAVRDKVDQDSIRVAVALSESGKPISESGDNAQHKPLLLLRSSAAYEIAASAASYVQSQARDLVGSKQYPSELLHNEDDRRTEERVHKSEMAACVAASTMTAVVAAGENQKEKAAKDLQSLHSSPCQWFVCDDSSIYTRCFVIQGSDSLASWQANLLFEPTKFEETAVLVHRGIYEAAKGIYDQLMPEIKQHLDRFGDRAKLQFTGHSLGGSLALLVNLILLTRKEVEPSSLLPVVTFGSPFIFCGGQKILNRLGLDENHVHCVMMHRDIVPRAFSCNYPNYVAQVLKRLNGTFWSHPCLNKNKLLYSPMGKLFILQPDVNSSPSHPLLPLGSALYVLHNTKSSQTKSALRAFLNSPHPLETLSDPTAYGSEGTILRDHDSSNYLKAVNEVIRKNTRLAVRQTRQQRNQLWPLLTARSPHALSHPFYTGSRPDVNKKALTGV